MESYPNEVTYHIALHLSPKDQFSLAITSKENHRTLSVNSLLWFRLSWYWCNSELYKENRTNRFTEAYCEERKELGPLWYWKNVVLEDNRAKLDLFENYRGEIMYGAAKNYDWPALEFAAYYMVDCENVDNEQEIFRILLRNGHLDYAVSIFGRIIGYKAVSTLQNYGVDCRPFLQSIRDYHTS